jgi:hypothetical protein
LIIYVFVTTKCNKNKKIERNVSRVIEETMQLKINFLN